MSALGWRISSAALLGAAIVGVTGLGVADAATGGTFILGKSNHASTVTVLTNSTGTALALRAPSGKPALSVNTPVKVANLNADRLDGLDSTAFQRKLTRLHFSNLTLLNGWTGNCFGGGAPGIAASADGVVHLHGELCTGSPGSVVFNVPAALRPTQQLWLTVDQCNAATGRLVIQTNGDAHIETDPQSSGAAQCFTSLAGVSYTLPY